MDGTASRCIPSVISMSFHKARKKACSRNSEHPQWTKHVISHCLSSKMNVIETTARAIVAALTARRGRLLPWSIIRTVIDDAKFACELDTSAESRWPCDYADAGQVKILLPSALSPSTGRNTSVNEPAPEPPTLVHRRQSQNWIAGAYLDVVEISDLHDRLGDLVKLTVGQELEMYVRLELTGKDGQPVPIETIEKINALLKGVSEHLKLR